MIEHVEGLWICECTACQHFIKSNHNCNTSQFLIIEFIECDGVLLLNVT